MSRATLNAAGFPIAALVAVAIVTLVAVSGSPRAATGAGTTGEPDATPGTRLLARLTQGSQLAWGLYQILWSPRRYPLELDQAIQEIGARPSFVMFFRDLSRPYPEDACAAILGRGAIPVISMEIEHWGEHRPGRLEAIARGDYDAFFIDYARRARESGQIGLFRFAYEMNGDWFPWGGRPETFRQAWRRIRELFRREGCANLLWVWAPNAVSGPATPENGIEKYWPGDDCVDIIGLDGYNFGDHHSPWHRWQSAEEVFGPALDKIRESGVPQRVLITEFACTDDGSPVARAAWIRDAHRYLVGRPEVMGAIWFNYDKRREGEKNWRIDADPLSLAAWRETFAHERAGEADPPSLPE